MKEIVVKSSNKVGALAEVAELLGSYGVNIEAISAYGIGDNAVFRIVTSDPKTAIKHLGKIPGLMCAEADIILLDIHNRPGELGKIARKLANKGVDLEALYLINKSADAFHVAIRPSKEHFEKTKDALGIKK